MAFPSPFWQPTSLRRGRTVALRIPRAACVRAVLTVRPSPTVFSEAPAAQDTAAPWRPAREPPVSAPLPRKSAAQGKKESQTHTRDIQIFTKPYTLTKFPIQAPLLLAGRIRADSLNSETQLTAVYSQCRPQQLRIAAARIPLLSAKKPLYQ